MLTGAGINDEIQALTGRTTDTVLLTNARISRWANEAQRKIIEEVPGIDSLTFKNISSLKCISDQYKYAVNDITVGDVSSQKPCHLFGVYLMDGNNSYKLSYIPIDEFDSMYPDPSHTDFEPDKPTVWTRRGAYIEVFPRPSTTYVDYTIRVDGDFYAEEFSTDDTEASDITDADDGIINYCMARAWEAIGDDAKSVACDVRFNNWLTRYKDQNDTLHEWEGQIFNLNE